MIAVSTRTKPPSLNLRLVRKYFRDPDSAPNDGMPTDEELMAREERLLVELCLEAGGDPKAERLGEHNCLFGEPEQPPRIYFGGLLSQMPALAPPPLSWFDHPKAHQRPTDRPDETHSALDLMLARHLAGVSGRPSPHEMSAMLRKPDLDSTERIMAYHLFACISPNDMFRLLIGEALTLFELVRALHNSGVKKHSLSRCLEQFAVRPLDGPVDPSNSAGARLPRV